MWSPPVHISARRGAHEPLHVQSPIYIFPRQFMQNADNLTRARRSRGSRLSDGDCVECGVGLSSSRASTAARPRARAKMRAVAGSLESSASLCRLPNLPRHLYVLPVRTYVIMYTAVHVRCAHRTSEITRSCARPRRERRPLAATREKRPQRPSTQGRSCAVSQTRLESDRNQAGCVIGRKVSTTRAPTPLKRESQRGSKLQNFIAATRGPASPAKHVIGTAETLLDARRELAVLAVLAHRRQVRENWTRSGEPCISKPSSACCALRPACGLPARTASVSKLLVCERCGKQSLHKFTELPKTRTAPRGPRAACRQARTAASNVFQAARLRAVFQTELPK